MWFIPCWFYTSFSQTGSDMLQKKKREVRTMAPVTCSNLWWWECLRGLIMVQGDMNWNSTLWSSKQLPDGSRQVAAYVMNSQGFSQGKQVLNWLWGINQVNWYATSAQVGTTWVPPSQTADGSLFAKSENHTPNVPRSQGSTMCSDLPGKPGSSWLPDERGSWIINYL